MRSPLPLREVLDYLRLEDVEDLVAGSVIYVGPQVSIQGVAHYWSYRSGDAVCWAELNAGGSLGTTDDVPDAIRAKVPPLDAHRLRRTPPAPPPLPANTTGLLRWMPTSQVRGADVEYVAEFTYDFDALARHFGARASLDKNGGGAGPTRYFFLQLSNNRLAMFEHEERHFGRVRLYLKTREGGRVDWEDYEEVMAGLGVALEDVFRQGGLVWRRRRRSG